MSKVDLHLHTTASDGRLEPAALVQYAVQRGLRVMAVTDHDCTDGLPEAMEAAAAYPALTLIPGVELGTDIPGDELHLLGYFIDWHAPAFQETLLRFRSSRVDRAKGMVEKLRALGLPLDWSRVRAIAGDGAVGRPHIALAMVEKGYVSTTQEAFDGYLSRNGPAYVEREKLLPEEAVELVVGVGGLPVLAHPGELRELRERVRELKKAGLAGMEVFYPGYDRAKRAALSQLAWEEGLIPCGGSDFHGLGNPAEPRPGDAGPPLREFQRLQALARSKEKQRIGKLSTSR